MKSSALCYFQPCLLNFQNLMNQGGKTENEEIKSFFLNYRFKEKHIWKEKINHKKLSNCLCDYIEMSAR